MQYMSPSTQGFYNTANYPKRMLPDDVVEVTDEQFRYLLTGQNAGKVLAVDAGGQPVLNDPVLDAVEVASQERIWRDGEFERVKWLRERHRDELEQSVQTTLTDDQYRELLAYMQLLREWPQSPSFPNQSLRPVAPDWISDLQK
ncbi:phage tail assembly chaperone [Pseudomonas carnis]|nr:phage tail assembly chaperone [Pseudomonas carnis]